MKEYRENKNYVDVHDQLVSLINNGHRIIKWPMAIFMQLFYSSIFNTWVITNKIQLYRQLKPISIIDVMYLLAKELAPLTIRLRAISGCATHRYDGYQLMIRRVPIQHDCVYCRTEKAKRSKTSYFCTKCKVHLHSDCFEAFHTKSSQ